MFFPTLISGEKLDFVEDFTKGLAPTWSLRVSQSRAARADELPDPTGDLQGQSRSAGANVQRLVKDGAQFSIA
ncbi:MAG: hypothetical protein QF886_24475, partial [Planctomycetota bacterium]|nr:hypothetical protein [Planctomycetota bacterium]